jgi:putative transposase
MDEYRHGAHSVFEIHLHLVWVTKYRKPVLVGVIGHRVRDLIREICGGLDVHILKGHVSKDHVPLLVSMPPQVTISRLVQRLKGKTAYRTLQESRRCGSSSGAGTCGRAGTSCCSSGNVTDEVVAEYIANQGKPGPEDFRVEDGEL